MDYRFERLNKENLLDLMPLFKKIYKREKQESYFREKYNFPFGYEKYYGYLVYHGVELVGYTGAVLQIFIFRGQYIRAAQCTDSMVLLEHRGKKLYQKLIIKVKGVLMSDGVSVFYVIPNQLSHPVIFDKLDWKKSNTIQRFHIAVQPKYQAAMKFYARKFFGKKQDRFFTNYQTNVPPSPSFNSDDCIVSYRSSEFYTYKQSNNNSFFIEVDNYKFWINVENMRLNIGDMDTPPNYTIFKKIMNHLIEISRIYGIVEISFQSSPGSQLVEYFTKRYKPHNSWTLGYDSMDDTIDFSKLVCTLGDLDTF